MPVTVKLLVNAVLLTTRSSAKITPLLVPEVLTLIPCVVLPEDSVRVNESFGVVLLPIVTVPVLLSIVILVPAVSLDSRRPLEIPEVPEVTV